MKKNINAGLFLLRAVLGVLMLLHGIAKLDGISGIEQNLMNKGFPSFIAYGVYVGEIIAPILLIIGFRVRLAALIFAFNCLVAVLLVHPDSITSLTKNGGWAAELLGLYFFGALTLFFTGSGKYAISSRHKWD